MTRTGNEGAVQIELLSVHHALKTEQFSTLHKMILEAACIFAREMIEKGGRPCIKYPDGSIKFLKLPPG